MRLASRHRKFLIVGLLLIFLYGLYWYQNTGRYLLEAWSYMNTLNPRPVPQVSMLSGQSHHPMVHNLYLLNAIIDMDVAVRKPDVALEEYFISLPPTQQDLLAASICYLGTANGFFRYFRHPDAAVTSRAISAFGSFGMKSTAETLQAAADLFQKNRNANRELFAALDSKFAKNITSELGGWEEVSDKYAKIELERLKKTNQPLPCNLGCVIASYIDFRWIPSKPIEVALNSFHAAPEEIQTLYAAYIALDNIRRDGFDGFFFNSDGWLAPEAADGFHKLGMNRTGSIIVNAIAQFGSDFPREREARIKELKKLNLTPELFKKWDERFYQAIENENGGWDRASNKLVRAYLARHTEIPFVVE